MVVVEASISNWWMNYGVETLFCWIEWRSAGWSDFLIKIWWNFIKKSFYEGANVKLAEYKRWGRGWGKYLKSLWFELWMTQMKIRRLTWFLITIWWNFIEKSFHEGANVKCLGWGCKWLRPMLTLGQLDSKEFYRNLMLMMWCDDDELRVNN